MTLNTRIWLHGRISGEAAFRLALAALIKAADRSDEIGTAKVERAAAGSISQWALDRDGGDWIDAEPGRREAWTARNDSINTVIGQGLPGIVNCKYRQDGEPLAVEDVVEHEDGEDWVSQRRCHVQLSWDTAYSYNHGRHSSAGSLHAEALVHLAASLPGGVTLSWENEYTGAIHDGVTAEALGEFLGWNLAAVHWRLTVAAPTIGSEVAR